MRDVGADLGGSGSGVKADSEAAARRRKMTIQLREARRSLSEPDAIPSSFERNGASVRRDQPQRHADARDHRARRLRNGVGLGRGRPARDLDRLHHLRNSDRLFAADRLSGQQRPGKDGGGLAAQVRVFHRLQRVGMGISHRHAAQIERPERAGFRHRRDAARLDRDVASGGGDTSRVRRRHAADDRRRGPPLRTPSARGGAADGGAVARRHRLFSGGRAAPACDSVAEHVVSGGKGLAHRRTRAGQTQLGRGAPPRRERQSGQVALSGDDEP